MEYIYINNSNAEKAGFTYNIQPNSMSQIMPQMKVINEVEPKEEGNAIDSEAKAKDITLFDNEDGWVPDILLSNIDDTTFLIFLASAVILALSKIDNLTYSFTFIAAFCLLLTTEYGVSIAIVLFLIVMGRFVNGFICILAIIALVHIFVPFDWLSEPTYNYILQAVLLVLTWFAINYNKVVTYYKYNPIPQDSVQTINEESLIRY